MAANPLFVLLSVIIANGEWVPASEVLFDFVILVLLFSSEIDDDTSDSTVAIYEVFCGYSILYELVTKN